MLGTAEWWCVLVTVVASRGRPRRARWGKPHSDAVTTVDKGLQLVESVVSEDIIVWIRLDVEANDFDLPPGVPEVFFEAAGESPRARKDFQEEIVASELVLA